MLIRTGHLFFSPGGVDGMGDRQFRTIQLRAKDLSPRPAAQSRRLHPIAGRTAMRMLDDKDVVCFLRFEVERAGGQSSWARRQGIDRSALNRVLSGRKPPTKQIIRALRLCHVYALDAAPVANEEARHSVRRPG